MRLSHRDFDALQRLLLELYEPSDVEVFSRSLPELLLKIIPADYCIWSSFSVGEHPKMTVYAESSPRMTNQIRSDWERRLFLHPFTQYFMRTQDTTALKMSDFMNLHQMRNCWMWKEVNQPLDVNYALSLPMTNVGEPPSALNLADKSKDFSERDRLILNLLRPHVLQARRIMELISFRQNAGTVPNLSDWLRETYRLTPRECEVAHWVMRGKSNPEIAIILEASPRTIEKHMEKVLAKLGVENRASAAAMLATFNPLMNPGTRQKPALHVASPG